MTSEHTPNLTEEAGINAERTIKSTGSYGRIGRMLISLFMGRGLMAIRQILMVPLMLQFWGTEYYGEWLLLSTMPSFFAISNLGLGTSSALQISASVVGGDAQKAWSTFLSSIVFQSCSAVVVIIGLYGLTVLTRDLFSNFRYVERPAIVLLALSAAALVRMIVIPCQGWWVASGRPATANQWGNVWYFVESILMVTIVVQGGSAVTLALTLCCWNLGWAASYSIATSSLIRSLNLLAKSCLLNLSDMIALIRVGLGHQLNPLWQAILFQGSTILAAAMLGPAGAAFWGSLRIIVRSASQGLELVCLSFAPEFQIAYGAKDFVRLRRLHSFALVSSMLFSITSIALLLCFGRQFFFVWTRNEFFIPFEGWLLLTLSLLPCAIWRVSGELQQAINQPWLLNLWAVAASACSLLVMGLTSISMGIVGFALGMLTFEIMMAIVVMNRTHAILNDSFRSSIMRGADLLRELVAKRIGLAIAK